MAFMNYGTSLTPSTNPDPNTLGTFPYDVNAGGQGVVNDIRVFNASWTSGGKKIIVPNHESNTNGKLSIPIGVTPTTSGAASSIALWVINELDVNFLLLADTGTLSGTGPWMSYIFDPFSYGYYIQVLSGSVNIRVGAQGVLLVG